MTEQSITVEGLEETQKRIYAFGKKLGDKVVYASLRKGANLVKRDVQKRVPVSKKPHYIGLKKKGIIVYPGHLRRNVFVKRSKIHRGRRPGDSLGIYLTFKSKGKAAPFYGKFINNGWQAGKTKVQGLHFIQKSFNSNKEKAVRVIIDEAEKRIAVLAKKEGL